MLKVALDPSSKSWRLSPRNNLCTVVSTHYCTEIVPPHPHSHSHTRTHTPVEMHKSRSRSTNCKHFSSLKHSPKKKREKKRGGRKKRTSEKEEEDEEKKRKVPHQNKVPLLWRCHQVLIRNTSRQWQQGKDEPWFPSDPINSFIGSREPYILRQTAD